MDLILSKSIRNALNEIIEKYENFERDINLRIKLYLEGKMMFRYRFLEDGFYIHQIKKFEMLYLPVWEYEECKNYSLGLRIFVDSDFYNIKKQYLSTYLLYLDFRTLEIYKAKEVKEDIHSAELEEIKMNLDDIKVEKYSICL